MHAAAMHGRGLDVGRTMRRAAMIAAVFYLALVQVLSAAHAASGEADAPNHEAAACVLCVAAHGVGCGLPSGEVETPAAPSAYPVPAPVAFRALQPARGYAPAPRGPPSH